MLDERALVDSNVLVYCQFTDSPHYVASRELIARAQDGEVPLCATPQVFTEFYSVVTDGRRVARARSSEEALDVIAMYLTMPGITMLPVPADVTSRWIELARRHPVKGGEVFDLHLVATMLGNGVRRIFTFNTSDFVPFDEIEVLTP